jgi:hypothetical protein
MAAAMAAMAALRPEAAAAGVDMLVLAVMAGVAAEALMELAAVEAAVAAPHLSKAMAAAVLEFMDKGPAERGKLASPPEAAVLVERMAQEMAGHMAAAAAAGREYLEAPEAAALSGLSGRVTHAHSHQLMWGQHDGTLYSTSKRGAF